VGDTAETPWSVGLGGEGLGADCGVRFNPGDLGCVRMRWGGAKLQVD